MLYYRPQALSVHESDLPWAMTNLETNVFFFYVYK